MSHKPFDNRYTAPAFKVTLVIPAAAPGFPTVTFIETGRNPAGTFPKFKVVGDTDASDA